MRRAAHKAAGAAAATSGSPQRTSQPDVGKITSGAFSIGDDDDDGSGDIVRTDAAATRASGAGAALAEDDPGEEMAVEEDLSVAECVSIDAWSSQPSVLAVFPCNELHPSGIMRPR